jgi:hypothetical protein
MISKIKSLSLVVFSILIIFSLNVNSESVIEYNNNSKFNILYNSSNNNSSLLDMILQVNNSLLKYYIENIQSFGPHPTGSNEINELKKYLFNELSKLQINVSYHQWIFDDISGENIVGTIGGEKSSNNVIIVCAHYDTVEISPGADDDGSGVAAILMMASILSQYTFNSSIKFILFSGEEQGLLGSKEYVKEIIENDVNIIGVLALDKIGYAETKEQGSIIRHHADPSSNWMVDISENISNEFKDEIGLEIQRLSFDSSSDHKSFVDEGFSGSNFVEYDLNPYYHTSEDLLKNMNISYLKKVCQLSICIITSIAEGYSNLTNDDISISAYDKNNNPYQARLSIIVENKKYPIETANLSITIEMKHIFRDIHVEIVKEFYNIPCIWIFNEEVSQIWQFHIGSQTYTKGFFILSISVHGMYDDFPISLKYSKYGLIFPEYNLLLFN